MAYIGDKKVILSRVVSGVGGTSDYDALINTPIINQDLTADGFIPVENTYYRHVGESTDIYTNGVVYFYDGAEFKAIDGSEAGGSDITVDTELSTESTNPVQNKVVKEALDGKVDKIEPPISTNSKNYVYTRKRLGASAGSLIEDYLYEVSQSATVSTIPSRGVGGTIRIGKPTDGEHGVNLDYFKANIGHRYKFTLTRTDNASIKYYLYHDTKTNIDTVTNTAIVNILKELEVIPTLAYMSPFDENPNVGSESIPYGVLSLKAAVDNGDGTPITINITGYINKVNSNSDGLETEFLSFKKVSVTMSKIY